MQMLRNAFWEIMGEIVRAYPHLPYKSRLDLLKRNGIAVWDVCESAQRTGSLDSKIIKSTVVPNDFNSFLDKHPKIEAVFFNGTVAAKLFRWCFYPYQARLESLKLQILDSTSPARTIAKGEKIRRWLSALSPHISRLD